MYIKKNRLASKKHLFKINVKPYVQATNLPYLYVNANELWGKSILDAILEIYHCIEQKQQYYVIDITMKLSLIWKNLIDNGFKLEYVQTEIVKCQRMKQMLSWIHEHYAEKILLEDIARADQLSRSECCRYFRRGFLNVHH